MGIGEVLALIAVVLLGLILLAAYRMTDELNQIGTMLADLMEKIPNAKDGNEEES